ncbi:MAG TPA: GNAT family N-acetyltransferase [Clostridia bacterium]|nr:GNAT family N-acetyltransferase [Clostridia bacterium]
MQWKKVVIEDQIFVKALWEFADAYFAEIISDKSVLNYFTSPKYRNEVIKYVKKEQIEIFTVFDSKIKAICFFEKQDEKNVFLMEYCLAKDIRNQGYGKTLYYELEKYSFEHGYEKISLTPTSSGNRIFWEKVGFIPTGEISSNGEEIFEKRIKQLI